MMVVVEDRLQLDHRSPDLADLEAPTLELLALVVVPAGLVVMVEHLTMDPSRRYHLASTSQVTPTQVLGMASQVELDAKVPMAWAC